MVAEVSAVECPCTRAGKCVCYRVTKHEGKQLCIYIWWFVPRRREFWGSLMVNPCTLVGGCRVRFLMRTPYCTLDRRRFGMRMIVMCSLFLPAAFFLCGFMPLCLELTTGFSHWWAPAVSVWGLLLPWLRVDSHVCKLSLQMVFVTLFLEHYDRAFLLGACWRRLL